jgi:hypothetical protein
MVCTFLLNLLYYLYMQERLIQTSASANPFLNLSTALFLLSE